MSAHSNMLLTSIDRFSQHLGPVNMLIDSVMERVVPKATARACHTGSICSSQCSTRRCQFDPCYFYLDIVFAPDSDCAHGVLDSCAFCNIDCRDHSFVCGG